MLFEQWCRSFVLPAGRDAVTVPSLHEVVGVHKIKTVSTYFLTHVVKCTRTDVWEYMIMTALRENEV